MPLPRKPASPFRYFYSSPEVIRLVVMMYVRFPLSLRNVETQCKIERWHQTLDNRILLENYFLPGDLEAQIEAFVEH